MASDSPTGLRPVQFSRLSRRGVILRLSLGRVIGYGASVVILVTGLYTAGGSGVAVTAPAWVLFAAAATVPIAGRTATDWVPLVVRWLLRKRSGQLRFRRNLSRPRPAGTLALPGDAARLREWTDPETSAAMIHDPFTQTLTAILQVRHPAFALLDPAEQRRRVVGWGRVLAGACRTGRICRIQVSERTLPNSGGGLSEWWRRRGSADGSWPALIYGELVDRAGPAGERHATTISISLDMTRAARLIRTNGGGLPGAAQVLRQEMTTFAAAVRAADLTPDGWLTADQVASILRAAYDPASASTLHRHPTLGRGLASAGPVAVTESWDRLRSDTGYHRVLWISEWPRAQVYPGFLAALVLSSGIQRTLSVHYLPVGHAEAARDLRRKKTELISDATQRRKIGQIDDPAATAELDDILQQESDLTAGHGVLRAVGLISITATTPDELEQAVAAIEQAAIQASCETRRLVGQQSQAFTAAALPLCRPV